MSIREQKLESLGYPLARRSPEGRLVESLAVTGNILYASGQVPFDGDTLLHAGKVPSQVDCGEATRAAALAASAVARSAAGSAPMDAARASTVAPLRATTNISANAGRR